MRRTTSTALFVAAFGLSCVMIAAPGRSAGSVGAGSSSFADLETLRSEYYEIEAGGLDAPGRLERVLRDLTDLAAGLRSQGDEAWSSALLHVAHSRSRHGSHDEAFRLFSDIASNAGSIEDRADALRMLGQLTMRDWRMGDGRAALAERYFADSLAALESAPMRLGLESRIKNVTLHLSNAKEIRGKHAEAIPLRRRLLELPLTAGEMATICIANGSASMRAGRLAEAVAWYDRLLDAQPDYGRDDGLIVNLCWQRLLAEAGEDRDQLIVGLFEIWEDPEMRDFYQILRIGHRLAEELLDDDADRPLAIQVLQQLRQRGIALLRDVPPLQQEEFSHLHAHTLYRLGQQRERQGLFADAMGYYGEILSLDDPGGYGDMAHDGIARCMDRL